MGRGSWRSARSPVVTQPAQLHVVGTPIGNLGDFSPRAEQTLANVGLIACEDTRRTGLLLAKHNIANPGMVVMNEHTEQRAAERIVATLVGGQSVAVVTDAGMPVISDPGAVAVAAAVDAGFEVVVVPGPTAVSAALAVAGFGSGRYVFEGFLPRKGRERQQRMTELADERRIIVLYEAPHRIERTLTDLASALDGSRRCVVARELTKMHETVWRGTLEQAAAGKSPNARKASAAASTFKRPISASRNRLVRLRLDSSIWSGSHNNSDPIPDIVRIRVTSLPSAPMPMTTTDALANRSCCQSGIR